MSTSAIVFAFFAALWGMDAFRLRGRARSLSVLVSSDEPVSLDHRFVTSRGVVVDEVTKRAASAFARKNGLLVLDLVASDLDAWRTLLFLQLVDPRRARKERLGRGRTAGDAMLVSASLLDLIDPEGDGGSPGEAPIDAILFADLALKLKQHACTQTDVALSPWLISGRDLFAQRGPLIRKLFGEMAAPVVVAQILLAMIAPALSFPWGVVPLAVMHFQCVLATFGTPLRPRDLWLYTALRTPIDLLSVVGTRTRSPSPAKEDAVVAALRPIYAALLAEGTTPFFEPRRSACPLCGSDALSVALRVDDHYQWKAGRFTLERCGDCAHVFQNPRLSMAGLDFYYRDFYDGLGEERLEGLFSFDPAPYLARARVLRGHGTPSRWLDVGAGHGHFCCAARDVWPDARFDGLDLSDSIVQAARRNWVDRGYRGLFPDLAGTLAEESYDVVSMSHYLEHTRDPRAEIEAAAQVLSPGGHLLIEVPDPESRVGRILGSYWVAWFQPQHQHFLSTQNLDRMLRESSFEPVLWHRGEAHQMNDLTFFVFALLGQIARPIDLPWRAPSSPLLRAWHQLVFWVGIPAMVFAWTLDRLLGPLCRRAGWSNTYRVLARRGP